MRRIDTAERRVRLAARHFLAAPAADVESAAGGIVGFHSSDPASVYLSAWSRVAGLAVADLEHALYDRRSLVRMHGMRRTMFVLPLADAAVMNAACTRALVPTERKRLAKVLHAQRIVPQPMAWIDRASKQIVAVLGEVGEASGSELGDLVPELRKPIQYGTGTAYEGAINAVSQVLFLLSIEGKIVRTRPLGTWRSSQYRWAPADEWLHAGLPQIDPEEAAARLVRSWLACYGPGTFDDLKWWTGWTVAKTRQAIAGAGTVEVELEDGTGFVNGDDVGRPMPLVAPWVALLPGLDPAVMGWKERGWFLGPHHAKLFDRNGNVGPTVWADGRIVGGWSTGPDGEVRTKLLEPVAGRLSGLIDRKAAELTAWLDGTPVIPRFRTPLEKELA